MKILKRFGVLASTAVLASCASIGGDVPSAQKLLSETVAQNGRACVRKTDIRGFGVLKHNIVSIDARHNYYLATVLPGCTDLQTTARAYFSGDFYEVCGGKMDKMVTRDNHCVIGKLYEFEDRAAAFASYNAVLDKREELKNSESN